MANYADADNLYDCFGKARVKEWANMQELTEDNSTYSTEISRRITAALTYATGEINDFLRNGPYDIPFSTVPTSIERACVYLAGAWLFEWRRGYGAEYDEMHERMEQRGYKILEEVKRGARQFDEDVQTERKRSPGAGT